MPKAVNIWGKKLYNSYIYSGLCQYRTSVFIRRTFIIVLEIPHTTSSILRTAIVVYYEKSVTSYYETYHHIEEDSNLLCYVNHLEERYARPVVTHCGGTECL